MEGRRIFANVLWNWAGRLGSILVALIFARLILDQLGREAYGIWEILMVLGSYYALADLGLNTACVKHLAELWGENRQEKFGRYLTTCVMLNTMVAMVIVAAGVTCALLLTTIFEIPPELVETSRLAALIYTGVIAIRLVVQPYHASLAAMGRFDRLNQLSVSTQAATSAVLLGVLLAGYSLAGMAFATLVMTIVASLVAVWIVRSQAGPEMTRFHCFDRDVVKQQFSFGGWVVVRRAASRCVNRGGVLLLGAMAGPASVPFFSLANSLCGRFSDFLSSIYLVVMPKASQLNAEGDVERLRKLIVRGSRSVLTLAATGSGALVLLSPGFLNLWLGPEYVHPTSTVVVLLAIVLIVTSANSIMKPVMTGQGRVKSLALLEIAAAICFLSLAIPSIWWSGPVGVAVALLITRFLTELLVVQFWIRRACDLSLVSYIRECLLSGIVAASIPVSATVILSFVVDIEQPAGFILGVFVYALAALPAIFAIGLDRQTRALAIEAVTSKLTTARAIPPASKNL
ncbi:oligosaccharide flippase family protein [Roseiconus lacunae]|uniref:Oligosaccharide flippase family protein n=1 Tax=Roseiconus lacunae TaxID=2605694 RepID=A0ABT7PQS5_9BACT|nr:oligosaccharide flippase family protein [Roseiconus lacunae]MDM4018853.1 oligosaccharide flippase family protein [Roseiconus lacunae]